MNASLPIYSTVDGIVTAVRNEQSKKVRLPIAETVCQSIFAGIDTAVSPPIYSVSITVPSSRTTYSKLSEAAELVLNSAEPLSSDDSAAKAVIEDVNIEITIDTAIIKAAIFCLSISKYPFCKILKNLIY